MDACCGNIRDTVVRSKAFGSEDLLIVEAWTEFYEDMHNRNESSTFFDMAGHFRDDEDIYIRTCFEL